MPDTDDGRVTLGVLGTQLADLREFLTHRLNRIDSKIERSCNKLEILEDRVADNSHMLEKHDLRIQSIEKFQRNLLGAVIKWGSLGAGGAVTIILIVVAIFRSWGWL
jgi:hypothetical protein